MSDFNFRETVLRNFLGSTDKEGETVDKIVEGQLADRKDVRSDKFLDRIDRVTKILVANDERVSNGGQALPTAALDTYNQLLETYSRKIEANA